MVHAGVTIGLDEFVKRHGGNPARIYPSPDFQPIAQAAEIPLSVFSSMLRSAAKETRLPTLSMEFAQAFEVRSLGAIGYLFELAPDLGTALKDFCAAFESVQENTEIGVETHGDLARISYTVRAGTPEEKAPDAEFSVTMLGAALHQGYGGGSDVCRVDLEHHPGWERGAAPAWLGTDFRPNSERNAIFVRRNALDRPGRFGDAYLYSIVADRVLQDLRNRGSRSDLVSMVVKLLERAFSTGKFEQLSAPSVASQLGMGERMLHRQLAACGAGFRDLRNSVMLNSAKLLLSDNRLSVTEAAFALGFSETSAFSRAFRRLSGLSPAQFRKI
ncbi:AraC family transcriptional regulator ligand-binding domain-containing protein [Rhizobium ruizarguesonis]